MGRKPIGDRAMTPAERQRRRRVVANPFDTEAEAKAIVERLRRRYQDEPDWFARVSAAAASLAAFLPDAVRAIKPHFVTRNITKK